MKLLGELPGIRVYEEIGTRFEVKAECFVFTAVVGESVGAAVEGAAFYELDQRIKREAARFGASLFAASIRTRSQPFTATYRGESHKLVRLTLEWGYWPKEPIVAPKKGRPASEPVTEPELLNDVEDVQPKEKP